MAGNLLILEQSLGSLALASIFYGVMLRWKTNKITLDLTLGALFGCGAVLEIMDPITIVPGVILDMRSLFVGFSGAYVGPLGALVTLAFTATARIVAGGAGTVAGLISMSIAAAMGLSWRHFIRGRGLGSIASHLLLGAMISSGLISTLLLPAEAFWRIWTLAGPVLVALNLFASVTFGAFIERERLLANKERHLTHEASLDPLTGLLNRRSFNAAYETLSQQPPGVGVGLLAFDIDHFKAINDRYGHASGDVVLQVVSDTIRSSMREGDLVARFGGEEFIAFLPDVSRNDLAAVAERARTAVSRLDQMPTPTQVTISIGAIWSGDWMELDAALRRADGALYAAKHAGRDRVVFAAPVRSAA